MRHRDTYLEWRRQHHIGCAFARFLSIRPEEKGQSVTVVDTKGAPEKIATEIARIFDIQVHDATVSAAAILLPHISDLRDLISIVRFLSLCSNWSLSSSIIDVNSVGCMTAVHLVRDIPFGKLTCPSEALVFGPFEDFPATRRAPLVAIELYVGRPMQHDPKYHERTTKANLAHVQLNLRSEAAFDKMWDNSVKGRLKSLQVEDPRAKAKVSFVIPQALTELL